MAEIASALRGRPHITAIPDAVRAEGLALPTEPLTLFVIDTAPASTLFTLARQFGLLGWAGWRLADTDAKRRELLRNAAALQRKKGTPASIKNAISTLGYGDTEIFTGIGAQYDGQYVYDGSINYAGGSWATFRVQVNVGPGIVISAQRAAEIASIIEVYKPARSVLIDVTWGVAYEAAPAEDHANNGRYDASLADDVAQIRFGTSAAAAGSVVSPVLTVDVDEAQRNAAGDVIVRFTLEAAQANGNTLREIGLLTAAGETVVRLRPTEIIKDNTVRVAGVVTLRA